MAASLFSRAMSGAIPRGFWIAIGVALFVSFVIDLANTNANGAIDLRNRITGARLLESGINPYTYKWHSGDPDIYCDVFNNPNPLVTVSKTTASPALLILFAIGVGGGYGTVFLATTLTLQLYFGARHYAQIFGSNQLFTTISVAGPVLVGGIADVTGRFDLSFLGCAALLLAAALAATTLRPPARPAEDAA